MKFIYFWAVLLVAVIALPVGLRLIAMRPWEVRKWRRSQQPALKRADLKRLSDWQTRNLVLFITCAVVGVVDAVVLGLGLLEGSLRSILWGIFILSGVVGLMNHFSMRCPRCSMLVGLQSNLLLPENCKRCRVAFQPKSQS
jgi:hypothetical protein